MQLTDCSRFKRRQNACFYVDYWNLNTVRVWDLYLIPGMDYCISLLGNATIALALDANTGYLWAANAGKDQFRPSLRLMAAIFSHDHALQMKSASEAIQQEIDVRLTEVKCQSAFRIWMILAYFSRNWGNISKLSSKYWCYVSMLHESEPEEIRLVDKWHWLYWSCHWHCAPQWFKANDGRHKPTRRPDKWSSDHSQGYTPSFAVECQI